MDAQERNAMIWQIWTTAKGYKLTHLESLTNEQLEKLHREKVGR